MSPKMSNTSEDLEQKASVSDLSSQSLPPLNKKPFSKFTILIAVFVIMFVAGLVYIFMFSQKPSPTPTQEVTMQKTTPLFLDIESPKDGQVAINGEVLVSGKTLPHTTVLIYTDADDASVESDDQGRFESTILLESGSNTVNVTAYSESGEEKTVTLTVSPDSEI